MVRLKPPVHDNTWFVVWRSSFFLVVSCEFQMEILAKIDEFGGHVMPRL
jgi:hypothetical protein